MRYKTLLALAAACALFTSTWAQWVENGDAGGLPGTAQNTAGNPIHAI